MIRLVIFILVAIAIGFLLYSWVPNLVNMLIPQKKVAIAGTFNLNGPIPDNATLSLNQRVSGRGDFQAIATNLTATDNSSWSWGSAKPNTNYDLQAVLVLNDQTIAVSRILTVTAPSTGGVITLNYNLPQPANPQLSNSTISGNFDLNGFIPPGATIIVKQKSPSQTEYQQIASNIPAVDGAPWSWNQAQSGVGYHLKATMIDAAGNKVGESQDLEVTAPANNEILRVNSTAQPFQPVTGAISGTITLNGSAPQGGTFVILQRIAGVGNFQVAIDGITPTTGATWSWSSASSGVQYELMAILKDGNGNDVADSQSIIVSAPASGESFTLNSSLSLPSPQGQVTVNCGSKNQSANNWPATISYPSVTGAQSYWLQLGSTNGGNDIDNVIISPQNSTNQNINATLNDSITYYARYAYSYSPNANYSSPFSSFSGTFNLVCQ